MLKEQDERNAFSLSDTDNWTQAPEVSGNPPFILSITRFMQCKKTEKSAVSPFTGSWEFADKKLTSCRQTPNFLSTRNWKFVIY